jgi:adenosylhomocysteine nucleosidase
MQIKRRADVGIIGAMQIEVEALCAAMTNTETETVGGMTFVCGDLRGKRVVCAKCGIGKVFAAMCAQTMILRYAPAVIINSGVAGTLSDKLSIGQIALAEQVVQHDMDTSPIGDPVGLISGINIIYIPADPAVTDGLAVAVEGLGVPYMRGTVASGDQFICHTADKDRIRGTFEAPEKPVIACEMEGAAIGQVCYVNGVPYGILRAISDGGDEQAFADYPTFLAAAAETATRVMLRFVESWQ